MCGEEEISVVKLSDAIHKFACRLSQVRQTDESIKIVRWFITLIYKFFPERDMYNNCCLAIFVEGFTEKLAIKTGNGKNELIINIMDKRVHIISPNMQYEEVHATYTKAIYDLVAFKNQYFFEKWWYSKIVDEEKVKEQLAIASD